VRSQTERDEQTLAIGSPLALILVVVVATIISVVVASALDVSVGLTGVLAGTAAMMAGVVGVAATAAPRRR
jgi:hypothetical protein